MTRMTLFAGMVVGVTDFEALLVDGRGAIRGYGRRSSDGDELRSGAGLVAAFTRALREANASAGQVAALSVNLVDPREDVRRTGVKEWLAPLHLTPETSLAVDQLGLRPGRRRDSGPSICVIVDW